MKTKRIANGFELVAAVLIAALLVLGGCPTSAGGGGGSGGNTPQTVVCPCDPKEHYVPCDCVAKGTAACTCVVLVKKGDITEHNTNTPIPVYQHPGVSDSAITTDVANVILGYASVVNPKKTSLIGKVSAIHIIPTASSDAGAPGYYEYEVKNGKVILKFKTGLTSDAIDGCFSYFVDYVLDGLNLSQSPAQETVRMTFLHTRQTGAQGVPGTV